MFNTKTFKQNIKQAMPVYSPQNDLERSIQDNSYEYDKKWLTAYQCKLTAKALSSLMCFTDWLDNEKLINIRISYIFNPTMAKPKDVMVFVTYPLFLLDILENKKIDSYLHSPVVFSSYPISHWLLKNKPIHIHVSVDKLRHLNPQVEIIEVGGLIISEDNISLSSEAIIKIISHSKQAKIHTMVDNMLSQMGLRKAAATEKQRDVWYMDEADRPLGVGRNIWDKKRRCRATIVESEPGEEGIIKMKYENNNIIDVLKTDFDKRFTVVDV